MRQRVAVVGAGATGGAIAQMVATRGYADVVLVDIIEGLPQRKALDIVHSSPWLGFSGSVKGTNDWADTAGSEVVVITSGVPRKPGMTREDLLGTNLASECIETVIDRTKRGGAEIVDRLKTGSAFVGPAAATTEMVDAILRDERRILPCCALLTGEWGIRDAYIGAPVLLGVGEVQKVFAPRLTDDEVAGIREAGSAVRELVAAIPETNQTEGW